MRSMTSADLVWLRLLWPGLLVALGAALTTVFACITPFAAFAAIAATSPSRAQAVGLAVALWLANQAVGYGVLHYPWNAGSVAWGVAIGAAAVLGTLAAEGSLRRLTAFGAPARSLVAFLAAFVTYQLALYAAAVTALGGTGAFAPRIVGQVLLVNAVALVGLYGLEQLRAGVHAAAKRRRQATVAPARLA